MTLPIRVSLRRGKSCPKVLDKKTFSPNSLRIPNKTLSFKFDRTGESEFDWRREGGRSIESALGRSDWVW